MDCIFQHGCCVTCGYVLPPGINENARRNCTGPNCKHLGGAVKRAGVTVKVKCSCKKKWKNKYLPVFKCDIFKRCVPSANMRGEQLEDWASRDESKMYALCQLCPIPKDKNIMYIDEPR